MKAKIQFLDDEVMSQIVGGDDVGLAHQALGCPPDEAKEIVAATPAPIEFIGVCRAHDE